MGVPLGSGQLLDRQHKDLKTRKDMSCVVRVCRGVSASGGWGQNCLLASVTSQRWMSHNPGGLIWMH